MCHMHSLGDSQRLGSFHIACCYNDRLQSIAHRTACESVRIVYMLSYMCILSVDCNLAVLSLVLGICIGSLAPLEDSQTALTNLGQSLAEAPAIQLAPTYVMVPGEFLRAAVQDAFQYQITQLAFADKVIGQCLPLFLSFVYQLMCKYIACISGLTAHR